MQFARASKAALADNLRRIIYVEGKDDAYFIDELLSELSANPQDVGIIYLEGDGALSKEISLLLKSSSYVQRKTMNLAFILDADTDVITRLAHVNRILQLNGLPEVSHCSFETYDAGRLVGLFLFPNGTDSGELEDLLLGTVQHDDRVSTVTDALISVEQRYGTLNKHSKRIARMYISVLPIKPCGVGRAYCEDVFVKDHQLVENVRAFLLDFLR